MDTDKKRHRDDRKKVLGRARRLGYRGRCESSSRFVSLSSDCKNDRHDGVGVSWGGQESVAALGESRSRVLAVLQDAGAPLGVTEVASRVGLHPNTARFHLDGLVESRLADRSTQVREQPGRPRVLYTARPGAVQAGRRALDCWPRFWPAIWPLACRNRRARRPGPGRHGDSSSPTGCRRFTVLMRVPRPSGWSARSPRSASSPKRSPPDGTGGSCCTTVRSLRRRRRTRRWCAGPPGTDAGPPRGHRRAHRRGAARPVRRTEPLRRHARRPQAVGRGGGPTRSVARRRDRLAMRDAAVQRARPPFVSHSARTAAWLCSISRAAVSSVRCPSRASSRSRRIALSRAGSRNSSRNRRRNSANRAGS